MLGTKRAVLREEEERPTNIRHCPVKRRPCVRRSGRNVGQGGDFSVWLIECHKWQKMPIYSWCEMQKSIIARFGTVCRVNNKQCDCSSLQFFSRRPGSFFVSLFCCFVVSFLGLQGLQPPFTQKWGGCPQAGPLAIPCSQTARVRPGFAMAALRTARLHRNTPHPMGYIVNSIAPTRAHW